MAWYEPLWYELMETYDTCIFCFIATGQDKEATVIKENKELMCFQDIYPAAPHHYLVIPKKHIINCHRLHRGHIDLVNSMAEMGKAVLQEQGITDPKDFRLGFHQPPYTSVNHLHLHVLGPSSQISKSSKKKFIPGTYKFLTVSDLTSLLNGKDPPVDALEKCLIST